ncbi:NUDIX domain-containing protein [Streptomyces sp. NPDC055815]
MRPSLDHLRSTITDYLDRHPGERDTLSGLLTALAGAEDPSSRSALPGHITCSGVVIDADGRVLHIERKASGLLLNPGGDVEAGDETLLAAALRKLAEETGIPSACLVLTPEFGHTPIDIGVHDIEATAQKGEGPQQHYDFRFVFRLAAERPAPALQREEVVRAVWLPQDEVPSPTLRAKLHDAALAGPVMPVNAGALIHDGQGRYLLHLRDVKPGIWAPGCWELLGGGREPDDATLLHTVVRELREEAGLKIPRLHPYAVEHVTGIYGTLVPVQLFTGEWNGDPSTLTVTEGQLLAWRSLEQLPYLAMLPSTRKLLERHATEHPAADAAHGPSRTATAAPPPGAEPHIVGVHLVLELPSAPSTPSTPSIPTAPRPVKWRPAPKRPSAGPGSPRTAYASVCCSRL